MERGPTCELVWHERRHPGKDPHTSHYQNWTLSQEKSSGYPWRSARYLGSSRHLGRSSSLDSHPFYWTFIQEVIWSSLDIYCSYGSSNHWDGCSLIAGHPLKLTFNLGEVIWSSLEISCFSLLFQPLCRRQHSCQQYSGLFF